MTRSIHLVHLYPAEMNIYGDTGNRLILQKRMEWRGIEVKVSLVGVGGVLPKDADIIIGGGGQDAVQSSVQPDLHTKADLLKQMADDGVVMLMVCGLYQLFGRKFITHKGEEIKGIEILPIETIAGSERLIGNINTESKFGTLVGYENHSGLTMLDDPSLSLGRVLKGAGNNNKDRTEGCVVGNIFATYLHGPILSKNPELADELIKRALKRKYQEETLEKLDDSKEEQAAKIALSRPR